MVAVDIFHNENLISDIVLQYKATGCATKEGFLSCMEILYNTSNIELNAG